MSLSDFIYNITTPGALTDLVEELTQITAELVDELGETCRNEGVEVLKATPVALKEISEISSPIINPTPINIARSAYRISQNINDFTRD
jgi:hypothetical protein